MPFKPATIAQEARKLQARFTRALWAEERGVKYVSRARRAGLRSLQIAYAVIRDISEGHLSLRAMSLVYYTVIAFVPLLALSFAVLKGLGALDSMEPALLGLLEPFMGEYSIEITNNIVGFVENIRVDVLSFVSLGILLYTVLTMMKRIEMSFNFIWSVNQARSLSNRVSEYLFAIIVSPLLILISVGIATYVSTNFFVVYLEEITVGARILQFIGIIMPFFFMSLAFAFAFSFIPNTRVQFRSAFIGGIVTTIAWKSMAWIFQNFITVYSANAVIYAAFFALILLMLFVYLGWLMLLIGSTVAYYHQYPAKTRTGRSNRRQSIVEQEENSLTIAVLIVQRFQAGEHPWSVEELLRYTHMSSQSVDGALTTLMAIDFIRPTADEPQTYLPTSSVGDCDILSLRQRLREYAPEPTPPIEETPEQLAVRHFLRQTDETLSEHLGDKKLAELKAHHAQIQIQPPHKEQDS